MWRTDFWNLILPLFLANKPLSSWPSPEKLGLDEKQRTALYSALRSKLSVIQGPPGTGKTYLAMTAIEALINNKCIWQGTFTGPDPPSNNASYFYKQNVYKQNASYWSNETVVMHYKDTRAPLLVISKTVSHCLPFFFMLKLKKNSASNREELSSFCFRSSYFRCFRSSGNWKRYIYFKI